MKSNLVLLRYSVRHKLFYFEQLQGGRPSNATLTNAAIGSRRRVAPELAQPTNHLSTAPVQAPGDAHAATSVSMNAAATLNSANISTSSSFSLHL